MSTHDIELYRECLNKLHSEHLRSEALNDIKNLLIFKPSRDAIVTIRSAGISTIVQCLNLKTEANIDLTCEVLKICFDKFEPGDVIKNYTGHMMYLLRHDKDCVRRLAIDQVYQAITKQPNSLPIPEYIDVFVAVAQLVGDNDVGVANKAILISSNLPHGAYSKVLDEMKIALEYNSSSKCNVFEVIINISSKSLDLFKLSVDFDYINYIITELKSNDVLYQMNIIELLSRLAITPHGINYLIKHGALQKFSELVTDLQNNPQRGLMIPGYMKFFGNIAHHYPREIIEKYSMLLDLLFDALESADETILPIALDTLGFIGTSIEGKLCLAAIGSKYTQAVTNVGLLARNSKTEIKIRALNCFASLISVDKDPSVTKTSPVDHRVTLMTREWFRSLSERPASMEVLFEMCKNPFPDIKLGALTFLDAVCQHQWGEELVARTAGFIEYLLDRSSHYAKQAKEAKYDIIKRLSTSVAFDENITKRLQTYVEQGPFYSETTIEVAMEED